MLPSQGDGNVRLHQVTAGLDGLVAIGWRQTDFDIDLVVWRSQDGITWQSASDSDSFVDQSGAHVMTALTAFCTGLVAVGADGTLEGSTPAVWTSP